MTLTQEVSHWLKRLLLSQEHPDLAFLAVSEHLEVTNTAFFPLVVIEAVELCPHLENALKSIIGWLHCNFWHAYLNKVRSFFNKGI